MHKEGSKCPYCGKDNDCVTYISDPERKPRAGDCGVCYYCGGLHRFTEEFTLRKLEEEEFATLPVELRNLLKRLQNSLRLYRVQRN